MLTINNLSISYNEKIILDNFSCCFDNGYNAITGPSGAGKTSIVNAMLKLIPYKGEILDDNLVYSVVFQENRLFENLTVMKNLRLFCSKNNYNKIHKILSDFSLEYITNQRVCELSGGLKRRVSIMRALLADYDVLILDEPFNGLDTQTKTEVMSYIKKTTSDKIVILISHDSSEVDFFNCKKINIINS